MHRFDRHALVVVRRRSRVCTYSDNIQLLREGLITSFLRPRLQALKRKQVFAKTSNLEVRIMKLVQSLVVAAALAIPAVSSFAQSTDAAQAANAQITRTDVGGVADGASASGTQHHAFRNAVSRVGHKIEGSIRPDANSGMKPIYFGN